MKLGPCLVKSSLVFVLVESGYLAALFCKEVWFLKTFTYEENNYINGSGAWHHWCIGSTDVQDFR